MSPDATSIYATIATHSFPFWVTVVAFFIALPAIALLGHRTGILEYRHRNPSEPDRGLPGETSLGALLALLGLLLGFTFSAALHWREDRATAVVEEAAAIGTAFLRADLLPDGAGRPLQEALLAYARTRVVPAGVTPDRAEVETFVVKSLEAQAALWPALKAGLGPDTPAALQVNVSGGVTEVLDAHTRRAAAASKTISSSTQAFLLLVTAAGVFVVGNRSALRGRRLSWRTFLFSIVLASVLVLIEDLDRPTDGFTTVPQGALVAVVADMEAALR
ncbi:hypothetical protein [Tropicimonas sp. IMCC6043]|uniref:bestrophin-like domain n=1 Tax=Tropicimonas sp. IMCC6043 TaxID=2510645 RepID=UPI00101C139E|nr:hypothetical protein [Tropicimonas sp. IMCC6043]RYH07176.1 hypothetical protein EU800_21135 [Tropicimonas sp. IMCC6043]